MWFISRSPLQEIVPLYQVPACKHNLVAIPSLSRKTSSAISVIQVIFRVLSELSLCVCVCVFVCVGSITSHDLGVHLRRRTAHALCVRACRAQIKLELSVWGLPAARCSSITAVHLSGCYCCFTQKERQQSTASPRTPTQTCLPLNGCQRLDSSAYSFHYSSTLTTVSVSAVTGAFKRLTARMWYCFGEKVNRASIRRLYKTFSRKGNARIQQWF